MQSPMKRECKHCIKKFALAIVEAHEIACYKKHNYGCELCDRRFQSLTGKNIHRAQHSADEKNSKFRCNEQGCDFGADTQKALDMHMMGHEVGFKRDRSRSRVARSRSRSRVLESPPPPPDNVQQQQPAPPVPMVQQQPQATPQMPHHHHLRKNNQRPHQQPTSSTSSVRAAAVPPRQSRIMTKTNIRAPPNIAQQQQMKGGGRAGGTFVRYSSSKTAAQLEADEQEEDTTNYYDGGQEEEEAVGGGGGIQQHDMSPNPNATIDDQPAVTVVGHNHQQGQHEDIPVPKSHGNFINKQGLYELSLIDPAEARRVMRSHHERLDGVLLNIKRQYLRVKEVAIANGVPVTDNNPLEQMIEEYESCFMTRHYFGDAENNASTSGMEEQQEED